MRVDLVHTTPVAVPCRCRRPAGHLPCPRPATQEDLLCDGCRQGCLHICSLRCVTTDEELIAEALEWARQQSVTTPTRQSYAEIIRYATREIAEHGRLLTEDERRAVLFGLRLDQP